MIPFSTSKRGIDFGLAVGRRLASGDATRLMSGDRELVGYGVNGRYIYFDSPDCPFPAIRFREASPEICAIREKELGDWKKLSMEDKKTLYRYSFCQTYSEFMHFTPDWKLVLGIGFWSLAFGAIVTIITKLTMYDPPPDTFDDDRQQAQLRRVIQLQMNPITGLASHWDYEQNKWKTCKLTKFFH
ncbi:hypothetical protein KR018_007683 [Drosophila ironensis]|nr:hypothetical protein KR018_007683 [Drosophila ironensis]